MSTFFRLLTLILGLVLTGLIVWAFGAGDFLGAGAMLTSDPWGIVTLVDLYLGFFLLAVLIVFLERKLWVAILWILPIPVLGNVWTVLWLVVRWSAIRRRLSEKLAE